MLSGHHQIEHGFTAQPRTLPLDQSDRDDIMLLDGVDYEAGEQGRFSLASSRYQQACSTGISPHSILL